MNEALHELLPFGYDVDNKVDLTFVLACWNLWMRDFKHVNCFSNLGAFDGVTAL